MVRIARILALAVVSALLSFRWGMAFFGERADSQFPALLMACTGGIIGAVAGGAGEIAMALRRPESAGSEKV